MRIESDYTREGITVVSGLIIDEEVRRNAVIESAKGVG